jgi:FMN phosphatase YigB (HAD superfamily)
VRPVLRRALHRWDRRRWRGVTGSAPPPDFEEYRRFLRSTLAEIAGHALPEAEESAVVERFLRPAGGIEPFPDAAPVLEQLNAMNLGPVLATDLPRAIAAVALQRVGITSQLLFFAGDDPGEDRLPARSAFRQLAERLETPPEQVLFVGDLFWSDVRAAGRAGLAAVLIDRGGFATRGSAPRIGSMTDLPEHITQARILGAGDLDTEDSVAGG